MKDARSAESNEKSCDRFFPFLVFEFIIYGDTQDVPPIKKNCLTVAKFTAKMRIDLIMILYSSFFLCDLQFLRYDQFCI